MGQNHLFINHTKKEIHEVEVLRENVKPYEDGLGLLWYLLESEGCTIEIVDEDSDWRNRINEPYTFIDNIWAHIKTPLILPDDEDL